MRLINADALIDDIEKSTFNRTIKEFFEDFVEDTPTVEAKPVVRGEWVEFDIDYGGIPTVGYQCSECGQSNGFLTDFCPNCGADMRGEKHD